MMLFSKYLMVINIGGAVGTSWSRALLVASALLAFSSASLAAGLGRLTVLSDLGQPLRAEIDVVAVEKGELESLNAKLGTIDSYIQNNLPYPPPSLGLKLSLEKRASGAPYISATTVQAVNEPFVDILVELTWNGGRILRAYTALLDPPTYVAEEAAPAAEVAPPEATVEVQPAPPAVSEPQVETQLGSEFQAPPPEQPETTEPGPTDMAQMPAPGEPAPAEPGAMPAEPGAPDRARTEMPMEAGMPPAPTPIAEEREYTVKRGDTLSKIARDHQDGADVSLEQMLTLLFRANQEVFDGSNMNRLRAGKVLRIPDLAAAGDINPKDARREVRLQTADFNAYRGQLAAAAGAAAPGAAPDGQAAAGAVAPMVTEKAPPTGAPAKEVLKLSKGEAGGAAATERIRSLEEDLAAREKTIKEQGERVAKLEKQVKDMQVLLELKSKGMAELQGKAAAPEAPGKAAKPAAPEAPGKAAKPAAPEAPMEAKPTAPAPAPAATAEPAAPPPMVAEAPAAPTPPAAEGEAPSTAPEAKPEKKKPRPKKVVKAPPPEPSLLDQLTDPLYLGGGAAVLALLGFLGFRIAKKRKSAGFEDIEVAEKKNPDVAPLTATDGTGAMAAAARAAAAAQVSEDVDPLAEAEIYLAYGRDAQAEEILKEALPASPRRQEIQLKLLEIYAKRKDAAAFEPIARDLQVATGGQGEAWAQAARLGYQLDPQNPRYAAGKSAAEVPPAAAVAAAPAAGVLEERIDFNIGLDDQDTGTKTDIDLTRLGGAGGTTTDFDLSNLGGGGAAPEIDLSTIAGVPERTLQVPEVDLDLGGDEGGASKGTGLDFDFDLNALGAGTPPPESTQTLTKAMSQTVADVGEPGMGTIEFDLSRISLDTGAAGKQEPTLDVSGSDAGVPELDLSGINLDLGAEPGATSGVTSTGAARDDHWYDVQTKFDLAKAYQEMGDKEGAREILREVIAEGDNEQRTAAQRVLEALA
jgi:pilus assembly protein FimV